MLQITENDRLDGSVVRENADQGDSKRLVIKQVNTIIAFKRHRLDLEKGPVYKIYFRQTQVSTYGDSK